MISTEDFDVMIEELLNHEPASFNMLCQIAEKTLKSSVKRWCFLDENLSGRDFEEDILNEIYIRLIKTTVSHFLLKKGVDKVNYNPEGFEDWMFKVAKNIKRDYASRVSRITTGIKDMGEDGLDNVANQACYEDKLKKDKEERLSKAFSIVLNSDVQVYKVLTWVAQSLFIVNLDVSKIKSNDLIIQMFENKTLYDMRDHIVHSSGNVSWLTLTREQLEKINNALDAFFDEERKYGDVFYKEFFMKKGGKATISDWVNRMNNLVKRVVENETLNS